MLIDNANSPPAVAEGGGEGWVFNADTGDIVANSAADNDAGTKKYNEY